MTSARKVKGQGSVSRLRIPLVEDRLDYAATGGMACMLYILLYILYVRLAVYTVC